MCLRHWRTVMAALMSNSTPSLKLHLLFYTLTRGFLRSSHPVVPLVPCCTSTRSLNNYYRMHWLSSTVITNYLRLIIETRLLISSKFRSSDILCTRLLEVSHSQSQGASLLGSYRVVLKRIKLLVHLYCWQKLFPLHGSPMVPSISNRAKVDWVLPILDSLWFFFCPLSDIKSSCGYLWSTFDKPWVIVLLWVSWLAMVIITINSLHDIATRDHTTTKDRSHEISMFCSQFIQEPLWFSVTTSIPQKFYPKRCNDSFSISLNTFISLKAPILVTV